MRMKDWFKKDKQSIEKTPSEEGVCMLQVSDPQEVENYYLMSGMAEFRDAFIIKCVWHQPWINTIKVGDTIISEYGLADIAKRSQLIQKVERDMGSAWRGDKVYTYKQQVPFTLTGKEYLSYNSYLRKLIKGHRFLSHCQFDIVPLLEEIIPKEERYPYVALPYPSRMYRIGISNINHNRIHSIATDKYFHALLKFLLLNGTTIVFQEYADLYGVTAHEVNGFLVGKVTDLTLIKNEVVQVLSSIQDPFFRTLCDWEVGENNLRKRKIVGEDE